MSSQWSLNVHDDGVMELTIGRPRKTVVFDVEEARSLANAILATATTAEVLRSEWQQAERELDDTLARMREEAD